MALYRGIVVLVLLLALSDLSVSRKAQPRKVVPLSNRVSAKRDIKYQDNYPFPQADEYNVKEDSKVKCFDVLSNDFDLESKLDKSSLEIIKVAKHGYATVFQKTACYQPEPNFHGSDSFEYSVCDRDGNCYEALVRINVVPINDAPTLRNDTAVVEEDEYSVTIDVLRNDEDVDGAYVHYDSFKVVQAPQHGVAVVTSNHQIIYTPVFTNDVRFYGDDHFIYQVCDNEDPSLCSYATVYVEVRDKCIACQRCKDYIPTFNDHRDWLATYFPRDIPKHHYDRGCNRH